jgi:hypothetical protein
MRGEDLVEHLRQVLQHMKAVGHLDSRGCAVARAFGISLRPIARDHLHPDADAVREDDDTRRRLAPTS